LPIPITLRIAIFAGKPETVVHRTNPLRNAASSVDLPLLGPGFLGPVLLEPARSGKLNADRDAKILLGPSTSLAPTASEQLQSHPLTKVCATNFSIISPSAFTSPARQTVSVPSLVPCPGFPYQGSDDHTLDPLTLILASPPWVISPIRILGFTSF
jgi:hypothetical protein